MIILIMIIILIIIAIMIIMIKIKLLIAVIIVIINSPFQTGDFSTGSTTAHINDCSKVKVHELVR